MERVAAAVAAAGQAAILAAAIRQQASEREKFFSEKCPFPGPFFRIASRREAMCNQQPSLASSGLGRSRCFMLFRGGALLLSMLWAIAAHATDGTWLGAPGTDVWNTGANWSSSPTVPDGTASFDASTQKSIEFSAATTSIGGLTFNAAAPAYTFPIDPSDFGTSSQTLDITGAGIVNHSAFSPVFIVGSDKTGAATYVNWNYTKAAQPWPRTTTGRSTIRRTSLRKPTSARRQFRRQTIWNRPS